MDCTKLGIAFFTLSLIYLNTVSAAVRQRNFGITGFGFLNGQTLYRGALIWDGPSAFAGPGFVFYKKIYLNGPSLSYQHFKPRESRYKLNFSLKTFNDRRPLGALTGGDEDFRNSRSSSVDFEIDTSYRFGFRNLFETGLLTSYEFKEYNAFYFIPYFKIPVAPFVVLNIELGLGERDSNRYLYGSKARAGLGYRSVGLGGFVPLKVGKLIVSVDYISVSGSDNRKASLVGGEPDNWNVGLRYFVALY